MWYHMLFVPGHVAMPVQYFISILMRKMFGILTYTILIYHYKGYILYRFKMSGYKVFLQDGGDIREGLTCTYCKLVLKDPVQTSESGQRFCWECYHKAPRYACILAINTR